MGHPNTKYIYIARNPKEVAISQYEILKTKKPFPNNLMIGFNGNWDEFFECFIKGNAYYGSWFDHVTEWWAHRDDENVLFLWYEDLLRDLPAAIRKIATFLSSLLSYAT